MKYTTIPLYSALIGDEYVIEAVMGEKTDTYKYRGYGLSPGSRIKPLFRSPSGDPTAYEVMGSVIALRRADCSGILVSPILLRQAEPPSPIR